MTTAALTFARATERDLDAIDELEQMSFREPWPRATFAAELERPHARIDVAREASGHVIAFCNYWVVAGELTILAIATRSDLRGNGVGGAMVAYVLEEGRRDGCTRAHLEVRRSNVPAIALYTRAGFARVHVRTAYYNDGEDAIVMRREL